jgi:hypothetical protein
MPPIWYATKSGSEPISTSEAAEFARIRYLAWPWLDGHPRFSSHEIIPILFTALRIIVSNHTTLFIRIEEETMNVQSSGAGWITITTNMAIDNYTPR